MAHQTPTPAPRQDIAEPTAAQRISPATRPSGDLTGKRLGAYQLGKLVGMGGMADVYQAYDPMLMRDVAVKVLSASLAQDPDYAARFRAEARRVAALSHPHLVPVYQAGEEQVDGQRRLYLVMPLLHESIEELLAREGKAPVARAVGLAVQAAEGLQAAHNAGLIHRDVKPGNILLDAEGNALLADFGLAREMSRGPRAITQQPWGTPEYMAPEHLRGDATDARADIYSLGVVLYELLTGKRPFDGQTSYDIAAHALTAPLKPPSTYEPSIPAALDDVVLTALSREPNDRYRTMAEFALALRRATQQRPGGEDELASAATAPPPDRPWSAAQLMPHIEPGALANRQRRVPWVLASVAVLLLATGLAGTLLALQQSGWAARHVASSPGSASIAQVSPTGHSSLISIQTPQTTPGAASTPNVRLTPTASANAPTPTSVGNFPTPTTAPDTPTLAIAPTPLVLKPIPENPKSCSATQTVTNNTTTTVGWAWQKPAVAGFHFQIDGRPSVGWPTATTTTPPQGKDTLVVTSGCKPTATSYTVVVKDSLGGQYSFVMTVQ